MATTKKKQPQISVACTKEQYKTLSERAAAQGRTFSDQVRWELFGGKNGGAQ